MAQSALLLSARYCNKTVPLQDRSVVLTGGFSVTSLLALFRAKQPCLVAVHLKGVMVETRRCVLADLGHGICLQMKLQDDYAARPSCGYGGLSLG